MELATKYPTEHRRLQLVTDRDGLEEAVKFAKRSMESYRHIVLEGFRLPDRGSAIGCPLNMREGFIRSYLDFKRFHLENQDV